MNNDIPAFPVSTMTLRDYFAAAALGTLIQAGLADGLSFYELSRDAYRLADAMLKAREEDTHG